jgi:NTE family protein
MVLRGGAAGDSAGGVAFVLGGGGVLGAAEVGMLRALVEAGITPDFVLGTSIGAINGAAFAVEPDEAALASLTELWRSLARLGAFASVVRKLGRSVRTGTHLHPVDPLRDLLTQHIAATTFEELAVPFQCVAANIERAAEHWFTSGPLVDAVVASSAVPGLFPPAQVGEEHYLDGGLVNSVPVGRAVHLGARTVFVLHVGRVEQRLQPPRRPWEVATVALEIARRHRFVRDLSDLPAGVDVHVLPTGQPNVPLANVRFRDFSGVGERIQRAYEATQAYLAERVRPALGPS